MKIDDWQTLYSELKIYPRYGAKFAAKPTLAMLDAFENEHQIRLPPSYRRYITVFGPGELFNRMQIASPGCPELGELWDLWLFHQSHRPMDDDLNFLPKPEEVRRHLEHAFFFAMDVENWIAWDLTRTKDGNSSEYLLYRVNPMLNVDVLAQSFQDYVETLWESEGKPDPDWDEEEFGPRPAFSPAAY
jgi:SMI1/KNR4 family protein SUKH-1